MAQEALEWQKFTPPGGGYEVELPDMPEVKSSGGLSGARTFQTVKDGNRFTVTDENIPSQYTMPPEVMIAGMRQAFIAKLNAQLVEKKPATLNGHQGEQCYFRFPANAEDFVAGGAVMRFFVVGGRLYMLVANGPQLSGTSPDVLRFLDSFKLTGVAASLAPAKPFEWIEFKTAGFRVMMPGQPTYNRQMIPSPAGGVADYADTYRFTGVLASYICSHRDLPAAIVAIATPEKRLQINRDAAINVPGGSLVSRQALSLGPYPGEQFEMRVPQGGAIVRHYAAGPRDYSVRVLFGEVRPAEEDIKKFFDSFQVIASPAPALGGAPTVVGTTQANVVPSRVSAAHPLPKPAADEPLKLGDEVEVDQSGTPRQAKVLEILGKDLVLLESEGRKHIAAQPKLRLTHAAASPDPVESAKRQPPVRVLGTVNGARAIAPTGIPVTRDMPLLAGTFVQFHFGADWYLAEIKEVVSSGVFRLHRTDFPSEPDQYSSAILLRIHPREISHLKHMLQAIEAAAQLVAPRTWNDRTGKHKIEAQLVDVDDVGVRLAKPEGKVISIPFAKLSQADLKLLQAAGLYTPLAKPARRS